MNISYLIDHTLLKPPIIKIDVERLCREALEYNFYSVCIPPVYVVFAKKILKKTNIKVCTVIGFPFGYTTSSTKYLESRNAVARGADELDILLNTGYLKDKEFKLIEKELGKIVESFPNTLKKIIIETAILTHKEKVEAALLVKDSGAEFLKTSSGFLGKGSMVEDIELLKGVVGDNLHIKASGGIKDLKTLNKMINAGASRIGTSSGVKIMNEFVKGI